MTSVVKMRTEVGGVGLQIRCPFKAGEVLTAKMAAALNRARMESIANNVRSSVIRTNKKRVEEGKEPLLPEEITALASEMDAKYDLSKVRFASELDEEVIHERGIVLAKQLVVDCLKARGHNVENIKQAELTEKAEKVFAENPNIRKEVLRLMKLGNSLLGD